ncbi:MAG TPA: hypothetical protein VH643_33090 [Gemmataceae bacterium]
MAFLTAALTAPSSARAGCDYPTHIEWTRAADFTVSPAKEPKPPSKPRPCSGPTCSRKPLLPSIPFAVQPVQIQEWGHLVPRLIFAPPSHESRPPEAASAAPVRRALSIYRPPRLLS